MPATAPVEHRLSVFSLQSHRRPDPVPVRPAGELDPQLLELIERTRPGRRCSPNRASARSSQPNC